MCSSKRQKHTVCSGCGNEIQKAHAVHEGKGYCQKCYYREFKVVTCSGCGKTTRSFGGITPAYCRSCRTLGRTCLRCGKDVPHAALIVEGGVACPSCARFFKEPQACPACGQFSLHLARDFKNGFTEPVCQRCRRKGHITCPVCGKNRRPAGLTTEGILVCVDCLATDGKPFLCPKCGKEGRRHSNSICQDCYWQAYVVKKMKDAVFLLNSNWAGNLYHDFMGELAERIGAKPAALRAEKYFLFFARLDTLFASPEEITEVRMIGYFGKEGLRRHAVPYGYLKRTEIIPDADSYTAREAAERRRQQYYLSKAEHKWYEPLIKEFVANQWAISYRYRDRGWTGDRERFVPKTITENLKAAAKFLGFLEDGIIAVQQIDQVCLDRFIATNPGSRNGIRSFIRCKIRSRLDTHSGLNWTPIPEKIGQSFRY